MLKPDLSLTYDVLIVGAGLAGLRAAVDCAQLQMRVLLLTSSRLCSGSSFFPLTGGLGAQVPDSDADKEVYLAEMLETGSGIADERLNRLIVEEIEAEVERLPQIGITPKLQISNRPACFAKRERHLYSWTGWGQIRSSVTKILAGQSQIDTMTHCDLLHLVKRDGAIAGAVLCNQDDQLILVKSSAVIMATGGTTGLYKHNLNTPDVTGTGQSIALAAGADLTNLEFMQFIPGLTAPRYQVLFSETTLRHCFKVSDDRGNDILGPLLPAGVSLRDCLNERALHGPFTGNDVSKYFDHAIMSYIKSSRVEKGARLSYAPELDLDNNGFIVMARALYQRYDISLTRDKIFVAPFAHCANGGIRINQDAETTVPGLWAAGEAGGGVHGADRHGGTATAACLIFGHRAAVSAKRYLETTKSRPEVQSGDWAQALDLIAADRDDSLTPGEVLDLIGEKLWYEANVLRDKTGLEAAGNEINSAQNLFNPLRQIEQGASVRNVFRAYHALRTAKAIVESMLLRRESRGSHYRVDYPVRDNSLEIKRTIVRDTGGEVKAEYGT